MTCREFIEFLDDYLDGSLPAAQRQVFEQHVAACVDCANYLRNYRNMLALGKAAFNRDDDFVPKGVPHDLIEAILAARPTP